MSLADTCKPLQNAAVRKFRDKHRNVNFKINADDHERMVSVTSTRAHVGGLKLCLPFLRCFGGEISYLTLQNYCVSPKAENYLDKYINQYCKSLISFKICKKSHFSNDAYQKPFKNVENVDMDKCHLGNNFSSFGDWFPNL